MIAFLIAWAVIGTVFFTGILLEHRNWDMRDALQVMPCYVMVSALWPVGLAWLWFAFNRRSKRRG